MPGLTLQPLGRPVVDGELGADAGRSIDFVHDRPLGLGGF
jgi:hypothetical protein